MTSWQQLFHPTKTKTIAVTCRMCGENHQIVVPTDGFREWQAGKIVQHALPSLTTDQRELLISQTCGKCFDELFGED